MGNQTTLHPIGLAAVILLGLAMLVVPRRYALVPMLIMACFISTAQRIVFATLDFNLLRIMILFGWARILMTGEARVFKWNAIDTLLVMWTLSGTAFLAVREGTMSTLVYRLGLTYDAIGMYFLFRIMIRDWSDVEAIIQSAALISVPVAVVFVIEQVTGRNMFAIFGGVPEITVVRDGRLRCRGPFSHPIFAGCFWAALMPMIGALWWNGRPSRWLAPIGLAASATVIVTTSSATPLTAMMVAAFGTALFPVRRYVSWMRWAAALGLVVLHLAMVNPVWHLLARMQLVGGDGWYRFKMIDEFIRHFDGWWLAGSSTYTDWWQNRFDAITNQFVLEGIQGGLLTLGLFAGVIVLTFRGVGRIGRAVGEDRFRRLMAWALGAALLVHCANFVGVSYFGQIIVVWYLSLAMVGSLLPRPWNVGRRLFRVAPARSADGPGGEDKPVTPVGRPAQLA